MVTIRFWGPLQTKAAKPVLGKYYREPKKSGIIPFHLIKNLVRSVSQDHFVSDAGEIVYYQTDPELQKLLASKFKWQFLSLLLLVKA